MTAPRRIALQPWMHAAETRAVIAALADGDEDGNAVRFVGGCLRDALAGRPVKDVDLATPLHPDEVMRRLQASGIKVLTYGLSHGTVTAVLNHQAFEITTLREDVETDGRRATVRFTDDWTADAARRDFTFNAMSCTPDGVFFDPFDGLADLEAGRVRFVGDARERIREDYLRLLRFFRFMAEFGKGPPDPDGLAAARELAPGLTRLSGERLRAELLRLLDAADPLATLSLMVEERILDAVLPEAENVAALARLLGFERALPGLLEPDPLRRFAVLLDPSAGPERLGDIAERLRFSAAERDRLLAAARRPPLEPAGFDPDRAEARRALRRALHDDGRTALRERIVVAASRDVADTDALRRLLVAIDRLELPPFPLQGRDLLARGVPPGPAVGRLLRDLEDWWLGVEPTPDRAACLGELERRLTDSAPAGSNADRLGS